MAMNQYMHPRNPFRHKRPDFTSLADKYDFFGQLVKRDERGRAVVDLHDAPSLAALTRALLLEQWNLNVVVPPNTLIPTVPLRLNYLLWLEDLINTNQHHSTLKSSETNRIDILDIGCGASCIYPLMGTKIHSNWHFVATESDDFNIKTANENIQLNHLQENIQVVRGNSDYSSGLLSPAKSSSVSVKQFHFCMCNPPFFSDPRESISSTRDLQQRDQPPAAGACAIQLHEGFTRGGEVAFVSQLILESFKSSSPVWIYTTMLGKKKSVTPLKQLLHSKGIERVSVHEMCQGRVMRWGLSWTKDNTVQYPPSPFHVEKLKERPPISWTVPSNLKCLSAYNPLAILNKLQEIFTNLKIQFLTQKSKISDGGGNHLLITAYENTWSHSRRKRREMQRKATENQSSGDNSKNVSMEVMECGGTGDKTCATQQISINEECHSPETKRRKLELEHIRSEGADAWADDFVVDSNEKTILIKATVWVKMVNLNEENSTTESPCYQIQMKLEKGEDREAMNQIMLYIRNKMT